MCVLIQRQNNAAFQRRTACLNIQSDEKKEREKKNTTTTTTTTLWINRKFSSPHEEGVRFKKSAKAATNRKHSTHSSKRNLLRERELS